jgi:hypothetical protein
MTLNNKANEAIVAMRRERVSQLVIRQLTVREIANILEYGDKDGNGRIVNPETGRAYTHVTIAADIKALKKEWAEKRDVNTDEHINRQYAEQQEIKRAGWSVKDYELVRKTLHDEMDLLGTKKPQKYEITVNIEIIYRIIELAESMGMNASEVFETALRRLDALKKLQDANS